MANKEKEIIKKLLKIAENQQKIIKKLAQAADPFYHKLDEKDPNANIYREHDPLYSPESMTNPSYTAKPKTVNVTDEMKMTYSPSSGLPVEVKKMLDTGAPSLKNNLMLSLDGKNVNVRYNKDFVNMNASQVKALLQSVLKGYVVMDPIGVSNPQKDTWHPNY